MFKTKKFMIQFAFTLVLFLAFPILTSAHAYIVKSTPAENQVFSKSPKKISIQFDETIQTVFTALKVFDMNGKQVDAGDSHVNSKNSSIIECSLKPHLPNGTYRIEWKVVSADGHPVEGVIPFGVGDGGDSTNVKSTTSGYFPHLDLIIIRGLQFLSGSVMIGLIFFYLFVIKNKLTLQTPIINRYKKTIIYSFWVLCLSMLFNLPLQATIEANVSWLKVFNFSTLKEILVNSFYGKVWITQVIILLLLFFSLKRSFLDNQVNNRFWQTSFGLSSAFLIAKSFTSHALSTNYKYISLLMDFLHLLGASVWTGSLMAMIVLLPLSRVQGQKQEFKKIIRGFFQWGVTLVLVLTITGIYSSLMYVTTLDSLITTDYGRILLAKIGLFVIMLIFAFINYLKGRGTEDKRWGASLKGEITTGFIILVLAVILTNLPTAASAPGAFSETIMFNQTFRATLKIDPKVVGANHFEVTIKDKSGKLVNEVQQVTLSFTPMYKNLVVDTVNLPQVEVGRFYTQGMNINSSGKWVIHLHILTRELVAKDYDFTLSVGNR